MFAQLKARTKMTVRSTTIYAGTLGAMVQVKLQTYSGKFAAVPSFSEYDGPPGWADAGSTLAGSTTIRNNSYIVSSYIEDAYINCSEVWRSVVTGCQGYTANVYGSKVHSSSLEGSVALCLAYLEHTLVSTAYGAYDLSVTRAQVKNVAFMLDEHVDVSDTSIVVNHTPEPADTPLIQKQRHFMTFNNVGSENAVLACFRTISGTVMFSRGCFYGTLGQWKVAVSETHKLSAPDTYKMYMAAAEIAGAYLAGDVSASWKTEDGCSVSDTCSRLIQTRGTLTANAHGFLTRISAVLADARSTKRLPRRSRND